MNRRRNARERMQREVGRVVGIYERVDLDVTVRDAFFGKREAPDAQVDAVVVAGSTTRVIGAAIERSA